MAKRPTPKKRRPKSRGRTQYSFFATSEVKRLRGKQNSPFAAPAKPKSAVKKSLKSITRIQA